MSTHDYEARWANRLEHISPHREVLGEIREELRDGPTGVELAGTNWRARVAGLPLVRHDGTQCVRLAFHSPEPANVTMRIGDADTVLAHPGGRTRSMLFAQPTNGALPVRVDVHGESCEATLELVPTRRWEIYLIHHTHLDIGYTDPQQIVLEQHLRYLDAALELAAATDDWAEEARFRWNVEATLPLQRWLATRPAAARDEFIERIRQGRFEVCALPYNMHTEAYSIDELAHTLRFAAELCSRHDIEIVSAMQSDVPGAVPGLATLLASSGVRFLSVAHNYAGRSVPYLHGGQSLRRPFWWRAPSGGRLLVWMTDSPHGVAYMEGNLLGLNDSVAAAEELLPEYLAALAERPYPLSDRHHWVGLLPGFEVTKTPYEHDLLHLRLQGAEADNAPPSRRPSEIVRDWNEQYAVPTLRMATNREFFTAAETRLGNDLDEWSGDWADWWADGIGSAARAVGAGRRAQGAVRTGQTLNVLADQLGEEQSVWPDEVDRTYEALGLFDEHTWGAANPWGNSLDRFDSGTLQWERKIGFAHDGHDRAHALVEAGLERLAHAFRPPAEAVGSILVVNGAGQTRTDLVRVFVPASRLPDVETLGLHAPDGRREPFVLEPQVQKNHRASGLWLSFVARDVPACGWTRYDLVAGESSLAVATTGSDDVLDDGRLRVRIDVGRGTVAALDDLENGTDLVDGSSAFGFNGYVYDRYATAPRFNHLSSRIPTAGTWLLGDRTLARDGVLIAREANELWDALTVRLVVDGAARLDTTYRLVRGLARLDIVNSLAKVATDEKESVYFVFPFAGDDARVEFEVTGGIAGDGRPRVPGSAEHMRAMRHWATVATANANAAWATLEAPLVQRGDIHLPYRPFPGSVPAGTMSAATIVSWAMNNIWDTNFPSQQGGETTFRYAVAPGGRAVGVELARSLSEPLVGVVLAGRDHGTESRATGSMLTLDHPEVELVHLGASRRGHDLVAVLQSHADSRIDVGIQFDALPVAAVHVGSFLERGLRPRDRTTRLALEPGELRVVAIDLQHG